MVKEPFIQVFNNKYIYHSHKNSTQSPVYPNSKYGTKFFDYFRRGTDMEAVGLSLTSHFIIPYFKFTSIATFSSSLKPFPSYFCLSFP